MDTKATRWRAIILAATTLLAACTDTEADGIPVAARTSPSPSASPYKEPGLCQPFPDRLIDEFVAAYNGRSLSALQDLVTATQIEDLVAGAYDGTSATFDDVAAWAETSWDAGDRMKVTGYSAFSPTKKGFQMHVSRGSKTLRDHGIDRVATTLDAISDGCQIASLKDSGPVQTKGRACAFYDVFREIGAVAAEEPKACADGSGDHARSGSLVVSTGDRVLVWGGDRGGSFTHGNFALDGLSFDPAAERWSRIRPAPGPSLWAQTGAWTGTELLVLGNKVGPNYGVVAAAYNPIARSWRSIDFPYEGWSGFKGVWTGRELVLWGGPDHSKKPFRRGAAYDPASGTWRRTSPAPIGGRWSHSVVWTGTEMIVWGGGDANTDLADGAAYDPDTDSWRKIAPAPISPRQWMPVTWTGTEMIVWGGSSYSSNQSDGAAYDPARDSWRMLAASPLRGRHHHSAVWTGRELIVFGGYNYRRSFADGAAYDPVAGTWRKIPRAPVKRRFNHAALWTDARMMVFGGTWEFGHISLGDGAMYDPVGNTWERIIPRPR